MSKAFIGDPKLFENTIESMEKSFVNIKKVFDNQNKNFEKINGTEVWTSQTQQAICQKYDELKYNYDFIEDALERYINFLKTTLSTYQAFDKKISNDSEINAESLTVN